MSGNILNNLGSLPVVFTSGIGSRLFDTNGKEYIDFVSGIGVNCLGHAHPRLVKAISEQAQKQIHISNYYNSDQGLAFSKKLLEKAGYDKVFFGNSGAEANEAAIKIARKLGLQQSPEKKEIVCVLKSFHGRTMATLSATGQEKFHSESFAPYLPGFRFIQANDFESLKTAFNSKTAAFMFECVQGEGGVNLMDKAWLDAACAQARSYGAIIIADEVQTGIGRTGSFLASEMLDQAPDVVSLAKGIASGVPMGACLARGKAATILVAGDHQSTFGGNPLACAAGLVVLEEVGTSSFLAKVAEKGDYIRTKIATWKLSCIQDIRGKGLMIGLDVTGSETAPLNASEIQVQCLNAGLCISTAGAQTLRFLPPLTISMEELDAGLEILRSILQR